MVQKTFALDVDREKKAGKMKDNDLGGVLYGPSRVPIVVCPRNFCTSVLKHSTLEDGTTCKDLMLSAKEIMMIQFKREEETGELCDIARSHMIFSTRLMDSVPGRTKFDDPWNGEPVVDLGRINVSKGSRLKVIKCGMSIYIQLSRRVLVVIVPEEPVCTPVDFKPLLAHCQAMLFVQFDPLKTTSEKLVRALDNDDLDLFTCFADDI